MEIIEPDARIADLMGLLYTLVHVFHERTDLYQLEKDMEVDIDDLMPIVYTASNLGLVEIEQGDIWITEKGKLFSKSGISARKSMLKSAIVNMEPFVTAVRMKEFELKDMLEELEKTGINKYNTPAGVHNLEITLIEWGIYSGLLKKTDDGFRVVP
ncbi:MAG: AAA-associated domain-containing protein [Candidatus Thermoplasmatota archaeon]|jgi:hypothetical protein|nr:AAA-associated domain-containing protein [Candidatus Thermoplasmatota archaeon]